MLHLDFESYTDQIIATNTVNVSRWPLGQPQKYNPDKASIATMAQVLLKLGLLNWRRGDFDRSEQLLLKAKKISADTQDTRFLSQCFVGLALVKTRLEKIEDAINAYHQAILLDPENSHLWNNLGNLYLQHHQPDKAQLAFKQSIQRNSRDANAWNGLAKAYYQNNAIDESIYAHKRTIELMQKSDLEQPITPTPSLNAHLAFQWFHLAMLYTKKCQYYKAAEAYQKILALGVGNAEVWNELGKLYIRIGVHEEAVDAFSKAIELNPEYGEAYLNLARAFTKTGDHRESIPFYMKSIEFLPSQREKKLASKMMEEAVISIKKNNDKTYGEKGVTGVSSFSQNGISWFYYKYNEEYTSINISCAANSPKKRTKRTTDKVALRNFSASIGLSNVKNTIRGDGNMPRLLPPPTKQRLQAKTNIVPEHMLDFKTEISDPHVWNEKGNIHFNSHDYNQAIISYRKAIELNPTFGKPYHNLALIQFIQGNYDKSILLYQESIKLLISDQEKAIAWNGLGNVYRCIKDYENVRFAYQRASELDKNNGGIYDSTTIFEISEEQKSAGFYCEVGRLLYKTGSYDQAASVLQRAINLEPSSGYAHSYLARTRTAQGRYNAAIALYRKSIDLIPNEKEKSNAWNWLGDVYRKLNDYDNALKAYQNASALSNDKFSLLSRTRFSLLSNCATK